MKVRPWPIIIIALIHILAPPFNIYFSASLNKVSSYDYLEFLFFNKNLLENIFWIFLPIFTGFSILKFRKWSYYLLLGFTLTASIIFTHEWLTSPTFPFSTFFTLEASNLIVLVYFLLPSVRNVYLKPSLRWWEQKPRYLIDLPILIENENGTSSAFIRNISEGGAMIDSPLSFTSGTRFKITFELFQKKFSMATQVVFKGPEGFGTFFIQVFPSQNDLNKLIDQLAVQGYPLRSEPPNWRESFKAWIAGAIQGKGLVPQPESRSPPVIRSTPKSDND